MVDLVLSERLLRATDEHKRSSTFGGGVKKYKKCTPDKILATPMANTD